MESRRFFARRSAAFSFHEAVAAASGHGERRIVLLHLLITAEVQKLSGKLSFAAPTARTNEDSESLTTEEAATLLSASRTHVISLIKSGALAASQTSGGHRRISKAAVLAYKTAMKSRQFKGLDAMMTATSDMGLYDVELDGIPQRTKRK